MAGNGGVGNSSLRGPSKGLPCGRRVPRRFPAVPETPQTRSMIGPRELAAMKAELGDSSAYQYAEIYAQWGDAPKALDWLETAYRLRDPGLISLKVDDFLSPLRQGPRFQEIERKLNIPD